MSKIKLILKIPIFCLMVIPSFILLVINSIYKIKTYTFDASAFSHFASDYHFVKVLSEKENFKVIASVVGLNSFHNQYILKSIKKEFIFNNFLFKYLDYVNSFMPWRNFVRCYDFRKKSSSDLQLLLLRNKSKTHKFSREENQICLNYLQSKGLKKNEKFVLINLRDNKFYDKKLKISDRNSGTRNQITFEKCKKSIKFLQKKGFKIIRWGRFKKKISKKYNLIDISRDPDAPHVIDFWLAKNCSFAIGSASGPDPLVGHFQNPLLILGHWPIFYIYNFFSSLTLLPNVIWLDTNKELTLNDMLSVNYEDIDLAILKKKKIKFIGNNEREIYLSVKQLLQIFEKKYKPKYRYKKLQHKYWSAFKKWDIQTQQSYGSNYKIMERFMIKKHPLSKIADISLIGKTKNFFKI